MQEQMAHVSREIGMLRKKIKKMLEIKNTISEMKNALDGFSSRNDTDKERSNELESISLEASKAEKQREKGMKKSGQHI